MQRQVPYTGSQLKIKLLETRIDKENKAMLSVRECLRLYGDELKIAISNYRYYCNSNDVINSEPYVGEKITDELVYRYARDNGIIPKSLKFKDFINSKKIHRLDDGTVMREVCSRLDWISPKDLFSLEDMKDTLIYMFGEETYNKTRDEVVRDMLK